MGKLVRWTHSKQAQTCSPVAPPLPLLVVQVNPLLTKAPHLLICSHRPNDHPTRSRQRCHPSLRCRPLTRRCDSSYSRTRRLG